MTTAFYSHPDCRGHDMGRGHPECPERLDAIDDHLLATGLDVALERREAPLVARADLGAARTAAATSPSCATCSSSVAAERRAARTSTPTRSPRPAPGSAVLRAAGAAVAATDAVIDGDGRERVLRGAPARPPRDARPGDGLLLLQQRRGRGAPCARRARPRAGGDRRLRRPPRQRHRGHRRRRRARADGRASSSIRSTRTAARCRRAPTWSTCRCRRTRAGRQVRDADRGELDAARCDAFRPQMIFISAGFDAHRDDELGQLGLVEADYTWITRADQGRRRPARAAAASCRASKAATTSARWRAASPRTCACCCAALVIVAGPRGAQAGAARRRA